MEKIEMILNSTINFWTLFFMGILAAILKNVYKKRCAKAEEMQNLKIGMQCLLRADILRSYNYHIAAGHMGTNEKLALNEAFKAYKALDGNHFVSGLVDQLNELYPTKTDET